MYSLACIFCLQVCIERRCSDQSSCAKSFLLEGYRSGLKVVRLSLGADVLDFDSYYPIDIHLVVFSKRNSLLSRLMRL